MPSKATAPLPDVESAPTVATDPTTVADSATEPITAATDSVVGAPSAATIAIGAAATATPAQPNRPPAGGYQYGAYATPNAMPGQPIMMYAPYVAPPPAPSPIRDPREFARRVLPFTAWFCLIISILVGIFCLVLGISSATSYFGSGIYALLGLLGFFGSFAIGLFAFAHLLGIKHTLELQMYRPAATPVV